MRKGRDCDTDIPLQLIKTPYQGNPDRNYKLCNIVSTERFIIHMQVLLECYFIQKDSSQWEN
jgi:hypothetical protein